MWQLVSDSKEKLQGLVHRQRFRLSLIDDSKEELLDILKRYEHSQQQLQGKIRSQGTKDKLEMLLHIEEHIRLLHSREDHIMLWKGIIIEVHQRWLETCGEELPNDMKYRLWQTWERNDSVWLLEPETLFNEFGWLLPNAHDLIQHTYQRGTSTKCYPKPPLDTAQVFAKFQERSHKWQNRADTAMHLYQDLKVMLECWPQDTVSFFCIQEQVDFCSCRRVSIHSEDIVFSDKGIPIIYLRVS